MPVRGPPVQHETADRCRESIRATGRASARLVAMFHVKHPEDAVSESAWPRNPCPRLLFLDERRGSFPRRGSGIQNLCRCRRTDSISFQHLNRREPAEISPGVSRRERDEIPRHMIPCPAIRRKDADCPRSPLTGGASRDAPHFECLVNQAPWPYRNRAFSPGNRASVCLPRRDVSRETSGRRVLRTSATSKSVRETPFPGCARRRKCPASKTGIRISELSSRRRFMIKSIPEIVVGHSKACPAMRCGNPDIHCPTPTACAAIRSKGSGGSGHLQIAGANRTASLSGHHSRQFLGIAETSAQAVPEFRAKHA